MLGSILVKNVRVNVWLAISPKAEQPNCCGFSPGFKLMTLCSCDSLRGAYKVKRELVTQLPPIDVL
jgi:hypothetical protein